MKDLIQLLFQPCPLSALLRPMALCICLLVLLSNIPGLSIPMRVSSSLMVSFRQDRPGAPLLCAVFDTTYKTMKEVLSMAVTALLLPYVCP